MCVNFQAKRTMLTFLAQVFPKIDLRLKIGKTTVAIKISILERHCEPIFSQHSQLLLFWPKFAQKWILRQQFQKFKSGFGISTSKIPCVLIFSQNGQP